MNTAKHPPTHTQKKYVHLYIFCEQHFDLFSYKIKYYDSRSVHENIVDHYVKSQFKLCYLFYRSRKRN